MRLYWLYERYEHTGNTLWQAEDPCHTDKIIRYLNMEAIAFDTHKFVKHLTESGFTEAQAEALAGEQVDMINSNLATKADIEKLRLATKADIEKLRLATKADIEKLRAETKEDIEKLRLATQADIAEVKADIEKLRLSTQADIEKLRADTKADIAEVKADIEKLRLSTQADIANTESRLTRWIVGAMIAQIGVVVGLIKLG